MIETLLLLNVCHFFADFTHLSTPWMLSAKRFGKPAFPILCHAFVHATLFAFVVYVMCDFRGAIIAFWLQLLTHFGIDILKGRMNAWVPPVQNPANVFHWWVFGFDQFLHQAVIITTVYLVCV